MTPSKPAEDYKPGDLVYLEGMKVRTERPSVKLGDKRYSPFKIIEKVGSSSYKLDLPVTWKRVHSVFHTVLLTGHRPSLAEHQQEDVSREPASVEDGEAVWDVEEILDSKMVYNYRTKTSVLHYLVKWLTYPLSEFTWEPVDNLGDGCKKMIEKFHRSNLSAPQQINAILPF